MKRRMILWLVAASMGWNCQSDHGISPTDDTRTDVLTSPSDGESDPFELAEVSRQGTVLTVVVRYSGGCKSHQFSIYWDGSYADSLPLRAVVDLYHDGQGDTCEAYLTDTLTFELKDVFRGDYDVQNGVHLMVRNAQSQETMFLDASER